MASEINIREIAIGLMIFSGLVGGIAVFSGSLYANYGIEDQSNLTYMSKASDLAEEAEGYKDAIEAAQITHTAADLPLIVLAGVSSALKLMFNLADFMTVLITDIGVVLGVGAWFTGMLIGVVIIIIIFGVIKIIAKGGEV